MNNALTLAVYFILIINIQYNKNCIQLNNYKHIDLRAFSH